MVKLTVAFVSSIVGTDLQRLCVQEKPAIRKIYLTNQYRKRPVVNTKARSKRRSHSQGFIGTSSLKAHTIALTLLGRLTITQQNIKVGDRLAFIDEAPKLWMSGGHYP